MILGFFRFAPFPGFEGRGLEVSKGPLGVLQGLYIISAKVPAVVLGFRA